MPHTSRHALLWLASAVYCLLVLPRMLSYGMFLDGIAYASIARNMAENYGSFWRPYYTATVYPTFYEHPPLGFWLQSWAYRLCGDAVYIEALWGFLAGALILAGLGRIWQCHRPPGYALAGAWFPVLLLVIIPMTPWILSNNMLETTMTVFIISSVYLCLLSLKSSQSFVSIFYGLLSGLSAFLAFLVKGPVALFTFIVPLCSIIEGKEKFSKIILTNFYIIFTFMASMAIIFTINKNALHFFDQYLSQQILASIDAKREMSMSRFSMLYVILRDIIVPFVFGSLLTVAIYRWKKIATQSINYRIFLYYMCIALAASLPILISPKQRRWYVFPSLPFYALAIAAVFNNVALALERLLIQNKKLCSSMLKFTATILLLSVLLMFLGKNYIGRDKDFHHDFSMQSLIIEERETISVYPDHLATQWSLVANMQRTFKASLTQHPGQRYLLSTIEYKHAEAISSRYAILHPANPKKYLLFKLLD